MTHPNINNVPILARALRDAIKPRISKTGYSLESVDDCTDTSTIGIINSRGEACGELRVDDDNERGALQSDIADWITPTNNDQCRSMSASRVYDPTRGDDDPWRFTDHNNPDEFEKVVADYVKFIGDMPRVQARAVA